MLRTVFIDGSRDLVVTLLVRVKLKKTLICQLLVDQIELQDA